MSFKKLPFINSIIILTILFTFSALSEEKSITFDDGSTYKGEVVNDSMEGKGVFKSSKNQANQQLIYSGEFIKGKFNGKGILEFYNGDKYIGDFINGLMHGKGILKYIQIKTK